MIKQMHKAPETRVKPKHVLSRLRNEIKAPLLQSKEALGLAPDTVKKIQSGALPFSERNMQAVVRATGISMFCLMENDPNKPLHTSDGKPFTKETFERQEKLNYLASLGREGRTDMRCLIWFHKLSIGVGQLLLAAKRDREMDFAIHKLMKAIGEIGGQYPEFKALRQWRENLEAGVQARYSVTQPPRPNAKAEMTAALRAMADRLNQTLNARTTRKP